jgi:raffinose/stachyose/melibiose transport system substrate-binding protein
MCIVLTLLLVLSLAACGNSANTATTDASSVPAVSSSSGTTASSGSASQPVTIKIYTQYSSDDEKQPYDYAAAAMKKLMPNVSLDLEVEAQDDNQKIKTYAAAGNLPDIFAVTSDLVTLFKKSNNILQLDSYVKQYGIADKLTETSQSLLFDQDGHVYAVPNVGQWAANLFINKDLFTQNNIKVPTNYNELLAAVKAFKAKNIIPLAIFAKEKWPAVQMFDMLVTRTQPLGVVGLDTGKTQISDYVYKNAATKFIELVKAGLISKDAFNTSADQALQQLYTGKAAMFIGGSWAMSDIGDPKNLGEKADILYSVPFADAADADATKWNMSGGGFNQGFAVSAVSKNKDIAGQFAVQFGYAFAEGRVVKRADPNPIMKNPPPPEAGYNTMQKKYIADSASFTSMTAFPWGITNAKLGTALQDDCQKLLTGDYTVDQFVQDISNSLK